MEKESQEVVIGVVSGVSTGVDEGHPKGFSVPKRRHQAPTGKADAPANGSRGAPQRGQQAIERSKSGRARRAQGERSTNVREPADGRQVASSESSECPLCLEVLDAAERALKPCVCGYQVCLWCLNRLRTDCEPGQTPRCPACRTPYDEQRFQLRKELTAAQFAEEERARELARRFRDRQLRQERLQKERQEQKEYLLLKRIRTMRQTFIIKRDLICVRGLPPSLWSERIIRRPDMFGRTGTIRRVLLVDGTGVYIEYEEEAAATRAIHLLDGARWHGREVHVARATVRYCEAFVQSCERYLKAYLEWKQKQADHEQRAVAPYTLSSPIDLSRVDSNNAVSAAAQSLNSTGRAKKAARGPQAPTRRRCADPNCLYKHEFVPDSDAISRESFLQSRYGPPPPLHAFSSLCRSQKNAAGAQSGSKSHLALDAGSESGNVFNTEPVTDIYEAASKLEQLQEPLSAGDVEFSALGWLDTDNISSLIQMDPRVDPEVSPVSRRDPHPRQARFCRAPGAELKPAAPLTELETLNAKEGQAMQRSTSPAISVQNSLGRDPIPWDPVIQQTGRIRQRTAGTLFGAIGERTVNQAMHASLPNDSPALHWVSSANAASLPGLSRSSTDDIYAQLTDAFARIGVTNVQIEKDGPRNEMTSSVSPAEPVTPRAHDYWPDTQPNEHSIWEPPCWSGTDIRTPMWGPTWQSMDDKSNSVDG
ncbi:hypothetical protein CCYA_CCYA09G2749 [Cyanidiococcus yangmingshanensis]|nr:hypothetical protein CCYA_CCYA09G2749 [Cyanidiococcus yangmingshanensis]